RLEDRFDLQLRFEILLPFSLDRDHLVAAAADAEETERAQTRLEGALDLGGRHFLETCDQGRSPIRYALQPLDNLLRRPVRVGRDAGLVEVAFGDLELLQEGRSTLQSGDVLGESLEPGIVEAASLVGTHDLRQVPFDVARQVLVRYRARESLFHGTETGH